MIVSLTKSMNGKFAIGKFLQTVLVTFIAASLVASPAMAQAQGAQNQQGQTAGAQSATADQTSSQTQSSVQVANPSSSARNLTVTKNLDYSKGQPWFPQFWKPYTPMANPSLMLTNTPTIDQLVKDGKLMLSLDDAISIALEN